MELMGNHFHFNGPDGFLRGRNAELRKTIDGKYANVLSTASWFERLLIRFEMWREYLEAKKKSPAKGHNPSPYTLW